MPTISDIIAIKLQLDASGLRSGGDDASRIIDQTKRSLQQQGDAIELMARRIGGSIETTLKGLAGLVGIVLSFEGFKHLIVQAVESGTSLGVFAASIGSTVEQVGALGQAFERAGGSEAATNRVLGRMSGDIAKLKLGEGASNWMLKLGAPPFNMGLADIQRSQPEDILAEASKKIQGIQPSIAAQYLRDLNLPPEMLVAMTKRGEMQRYLADVKAAGAVPTTPQAEAARRLTEQFAGLRQMSDQVWRDLVTLTEPWLSKLLSWIETGLEWLDDIERRLIGSPASPRSLMRSTVPSTGGGSSPSTPSATSPATRISAERPARAGRSADSLGPSRIPANRQQTASIAAEEWRRAGMGEAGVAGVLANIREESNFDPTLRHPDQPHWSGEAHFAHGLYQEGGAEWNHYASWLGRNYPGRDWRDPKLQSEFAAWNLKTNYPNVWARMQRGSREEAASAYVSGYLKPAKAFELSRIQKFYQRGVPPAPGQPSPHSLLRMPFAGAGAGTALDAETIKHITNNNESVSQVNRVEVHTPATDAKGIAAAIREELGRSLGAPIGAGE